MTAMTALRALARNVSGSAALIRPSLATGTGPVALTDAQLDQVIGGGLARMAAALCALGGCLLAPPAFAQMNTCGNALLQLQQYVAMVNQTAHFEFSRGIAMRCGGNPYCGRALLQQLNFWYAQQANLVNNYYMQISQQCSSRVPSPLPPRPGGGGISRTIDEEDVTDLRVDDEDRTVRIRIPSTPQGFQPR
jgi:hypothetical protein